MHSARAKRIVKLCKEDNKKQQMLKEEIERKQNNTLIEEWITSLPEEFKKSSVGLSESFEEPYSPDVTEYIPSTSSSTSSESCRDHVKKKKKLSIRSDTPQDIQFESSNLSIPIPIQNIITFDLIEQDNTANVDVDITKQKTIKYGNNSKRVRTTDFCFYCESDVNNFARHINRNHSHETQVAKIFALPPKSAQRKVLLAILRKKGNFVKNSQSCEKPVRKTALPFRTNYVPCKYCLGYYSSKQLYRHIKRCKAVSGKPSTELSYLTDAQNILLRHIKVDKELAEKVFPKMHADKVSLAIKRDKLICLFGARYIKCHREKHFVNVCSRKMRELGKLLLEVQEAKPSIKSLWDALNPENFDLFVQCTKNIARYDSVNDKYESPTYAVNIATALKQCCDIAMLSVLKQKSFGQTVAAAEAEHVFATFKQLLENSWRFEISTKAAADLNVQKWNKMSMIPLAQDLKRLRNYLQKKADDAFTNLNKNENMAAYKILLETVFCRLLLLNRKRVGELQRMPLHIYTHTNNSESYEEFSQAISPTEKILLKKFKRVVIRGKRGRGVPVLFSTNLQQHTDILVKLRSNFIDDKNSYLFANIGTNNPITGYKTFQKYVNKCGAKNPRSLTSTKLRKHLATLSQLFSMSENDIEQLATFMGHTQNIHKQVYRLPDDVYQTAKISKLLLLMEKGEAAQYKGKTLDEIDLDLDIDVEEIESDVEENQNNVEDDNSELSAEQQNLNEATTSQPALPHKKSKGKSRILVPWTEYQKSEAKTFFKKHIKNRKPPKQSEIETLRSKTGDLYHNKTWQQVKVFIQNIYSKS